jgi:hypothetical protein
MIQTRQRLKIIVFCAVILVVDWFLYFRHAGHFFQGDTVFLINNRANSLSGFLNEFIELHRSGWYRPLANELFESILYPFAGLNPIPYRIPVYAVFIAVTIGVYALVLALTRRHLAAAIATFFFTIHTVNAYTTYDLGFMPELLFGFLYVAATLAYLRYVENGSKAAYLLSLGCFIGSLFSKEAAVTLPATLILVSVVFGPGFSSFRERSMQAVRSTLPHVLIMVVYLAFAIGYLHIQDVSISKIFDSSQKPNPGDYVLVLNKGVFKNADLALSWAFNIPRGSWGQMQSVNAGMVDYLKIFRALVFALAAVLLFTAQRKGIIFGAAWFWITLLPALPLVSHFIPYYLFLPVVGLSLVVGLAFVWLYDLLYRFQAVVAGAAVVVIFAGVLNATSRTIHADIESNNLLGGSAKLALNTLNDLKTFYPVLPPEVTLFFADANESLAWQHDFGGLIKMAYGTDNFSTHYESQGDSLFPEVKNVLVFEVRNGHLVNETFHYLSNPARFMKFTESDHELLLSTAEVTAGQDKYVMSIHELKNTVARIAYTINGGPLEVFTARFDADGKATFDVSRRTRKGVYRFWGFKIPEAESWYRAQQTLTVR